MADSQFNITEIVHQHKSYEEYLDKNISEEDVFFLGSREVARQILEMSSLRGEIIKREEFESAKKEMQVTRMRGQAFTTAQNASANAQLQDYKFLFALAQREEYVREGKLACIIFIRDKNHAGQEISGYIDYGHRLKTDDFGQYFRREKKLLPRSTDLSFYNWDTQFISSQVSENFELMADNEAGFLFKCRRDRKIINVDPAATLDEKTQRFVIDSSHEYMHVVIYDHVLRRKM
ncbi:Conserved_hypothetical protein [Hexamita inflata]|uniref:Cilia- and flagella-associated protein 299 n=1 Tax=Hexamita inflata TaxID=28002 RepID=A0AA86NYH1_9EUKA|nr:Conserved hypothetical protein [Hexamita inflata]CAI9942912.1 Conserved hypothetical protein [Hexamita inflata]